jgi:hypothetical protein
MDELHQNDVANRFAINRLFHALTLLSPDPDGTRLDINPLQATLKQLKDTANRVGLNLDLGDDRLATNFTKTMLQTGLQ